MGKAEDAAPGGPIEGLAKAGQRVLALDLRGMGETSPGKPSTSRPGLFGVDYKEAYLGLHLNRPLLGQRVHDLLAVLEAMAADGAKAVDLVGVGTAGPVALHAAALDPRIKRLTLRRSLVSWSAVVRTPISHNQLTNVVPGALKSYDLSDLAAALAPRPLTIREAVDPLGKPLTAAVLESAYSSARAAYRASAAEANLILVAK
jgi:pimeloyl-ACP methyl ester carboxylesterase